MYLLLKSRFDHFVYENILYNQIAQHFKTFIIKVKVKLRYL